MIVYSIKLLEGNDYIYKKLFNGNDDLLRLNTFHLNMRK